jgi:hypothetical protein
MTIRVRTAASVAAVAVIGIGVGGVAYADSGSGSSTPASSTHTSAAASAAARRHPILRHLLHGQLVLGTRQGDVTVDLQQGRVTAISPTSISVRSRDGVADTYVVTAATKVRSRGKVLSESAVATGDHVFIVALTNGQGTMTARAIRGVTAASSAS